MTALSSAQSMPEVNNARSQMMSANSNIQLFHADSIKRETNAGISNATSIIKDESATTSKLRAIAEKVKSAWIFIRKKSMSMSRNPKGRKTNAKSFLKGTAIGTSALLVIKYAMTSVKKVIATEILARIPTNSQFAIISNIICPVPINSASAFTKRFNAISAVGSMQPNHVLISLPRLKASHVRYATRFTRQISKIKCPIALIVVIPFAKNALSTGKRKKGAPTTNAFCAAQDQHR